MVGDVDGALRCPTCGKGWPANYSTCPDDKTELVVAASVHVAETMLLANKRSKHAVANAGFGDEALTRIRPDDQYTDPSVASPFDSDAGTFLAPRPQREEHVEDPPRMKSSDPPTVLVRRLEGHIDLPPGSTVDEYEIDAKLGAGAMGEVYAGRHLKLGKRVAIKVISPRLSEDTAAVERFSQEARVLAQIQHPAIVAVEHVGELADGRAYFVMEYLSGETLYDRLERGMLDRDEGLDICGQMARALEAAHTHGVVHRDLKPDNTFLVRVANELRPTVRLLDFGLAKLSLEVDRRAERTQSGVVIGTALYLSPEQARGPDVDGRTDIYALGCVAYEMFVGRHPFEGARTVAALIAAHLHDVPPMPCSLDPSIPPELDLLLFAMLAKDPAHRPTLQQIRSVIASVRSTTSAPATAHVRNTPLAQSGSRTGVIAGVALFVGILIGASALGSRSDHDKTSASSVPRLTAHIDGGDASDVPVVPPPPGPDAAVTEMEPPHIIDAGATRPRHTVVTVAPVDAASPVVAAPQIDAAMQEAAPEAAIEIEAPVAPASVHRRPPPKPRESPPTNDRNQTLNPFAKKVPLR